MLPFLRKLLGNPATNPPELVLRPKIDLGLFTCDHTRLGNYINHADSFTGKFGQDGILAAPQTGLELTLADSRLDSIFITVADFQGQLTRQGNPLPFTAATTESDVRALFGEPYWRDEDTDEIILFYEYQRGTVELQFEFPGKQSLGFITLSRNGVLSSAEQRSAYGVTKLWPPAT